MNAGNLISVSSTFSKSGLYFWKFLVHELLKPSFKDWIITLLTYEMNITERLFEHSLALPFFEVGIKTPLFQSCGHC